jgi:uncharacterized protein (TIGR02444 family)
MTSEGVFWAFSLRLYGEKGVPEATLVLQDECGADVDIVLYILWRASGGVCLDEVAIDTAVSSVAAWVQQVVLPLRAVRRALKTRLADVSPADAEALRSRVKAEELEAERLQHQALERLAPPASGIPVDPGPALAAYAARLAKPFPSDAVATLVTAMRAVTPASA